MVTDIEQLRADAHKKVDEADAPLLIQFLKSKERQSIYSDELLALLQEESEAYKHGAGTTFSEEEFWQRIKEKTGYQRRSHGA